MKFSSKVFCRLFFLLLGTTINAYGQSTDFPDLIPIDPNTQGYKIDNRELTFKESVKLPARSSFENSITIDATHRIANLIADEQRDYWSDPARQVVVIDTVTGDVEKTRYKGNILCFADGYIALRTFENGPGLHRTFFYGRFGENLKSWEDVLFPDGMRLNVLSCKLVPIAASRGNRNDGIPSISNPLREDHGFLLVTESTPVSSGSAKIPDDQKAFMEQPFLKSMAMAGPAEQWILKKKNGEEILIPKNPREAVFGTVHYLPYMDAYFLANKSRAFIPENMRSSPVFSRLLYPDGRMVRFGIPDVIWTPCWQVQISCQSIYTKKGLVWKIQFVRDRRGDSKYKGELKEGFYLELREGKILARLPHLLSEKSPEDGCTVETRKKIAQKKPTFLFTLYTINLCENN